MWPESLHAGYSERGSEISGSRRLKRSCSSLSSTTPRRASRGARRPGCPASFGSLGHRSTKRRADYGRSGLSSSTSRAVRAERPAIGSGTFERFRHVRSHDRLRGRTCRITGASSTWSTCPTIGPEGRSTSDGRSSHVQSSHTCITLSGQLAARCPSGEEAQGEVTSGSRSRSCPLPRALAGEASVPEGSRLRAGRLNRDGLTGWRSKATSDAATVVGFSVRGGIDGIEEQQ